MNVLITAGPTREWMDPVRFLSNPSSGSMGIILADSLRRAGFKVTLVLGPTALKPSRAILVVRVETALEMQSAVKKVLPKSDVFVSAAAVGDWRFDRVSPSKLKKPASDKITVVLTKNPDILAEAGRSKRKRRKPLLLIGFALETHARERNAKKKLSDKNLDLIIANQPDSFGAETIRPVWIEKGEALKRFPRMTKKKLSQKLAAWLKSTWKKTSFKN